MPQLDTVYIFMTFLWTWSVLYLITQKMKTFTLTNPQKSTTLNKPTPQLLWL